MSRIVDERTRVLGDQIGATASDLRTIAGDLRDSATLSPFAEYADQGAEAVDRLARYLRDSTGERLLGDLENLARRQPWLLAAGALALGFAGSRFLKTSSTRRYRSSFGDTGVASATVGAAPYGRTGSGYGTLPTYGGGADLGGRSGRSGS